MNPKISIIVPVYKAEPYLKKCVDSILMQTFIDFELLLINDGSPDNCGVICDDYAKQDSRIVVIHKENGGQSSARNVGLDAAIGEYVGFVDSDDWIEPDMFESLYQACVNHDCDVACCTSTIYFSHKTVRTGSDTYVFHNRNEAMEAILEGKLYDEVVWTKLFKKSVIEDIRFPIGFIYEDTAFTYKVVHRSQKICCIGEAKYNYIKRERSTMDQAIKNISIDAVLIYEEMYLFIKQHYPKLINLVALKLADSSMSVLNLILESGQFKEHEEKYFRVTQILNRYFNKTIRLPEYPRTVKLLLSATKMFPLSYKILMNFASKRKEI